jgi:predicted GIY-YIG superfamily endonuclease
VPFSVYVIQLDDSRRRATRRPAVYVGQTAKTPEERFAQHKRGERHARVVRDHGVLLCPLLFERFNPIDSRQAAEQAEVRLGEALRRLGFTVYGAH